ncbi:MAG: DUF1616 domain-containing protein [Ktedonobacteraceae bacterium]
MRLKNLDLIVIMGIAGLNLVWALLPYHIPILGVILALPLVFVLPGYTLTQALFHKQALEATKLLLFSLALSLVIDILSGFILNLLPAGLQAKTWAVLLGLLTAMLAILVAYLRQGVPVNSKQRLRFSLSIQDGIVFGLAMIVLILSVLYSINGAEQQPHPGFTQLWLLPPDQTRKNCAVRLGVHSFELTSTRYRVTMTMNGAQVASWPSVVLAPQEEWDQLVPITPGTGGKAAIEVRLFRSNEPESVYQQVNSTIAIGARDYCSNSRTSSSWPEGASVQIVPVVIWKNQLRQ